MQSLLNRLSEICTQHFFEEKILVVDSYQLGEQILLNLAKHNHSTINLKIKTIRQIALEIIENYSNEKVEIIKDSIGAYYISTIFHKLKDENSLLYFRQLEVTPTLSTKLHQTIKELRLAGYHSTSIHENHFICSEKYHDFKKLITAYESFLVNNQVIDDADLYIKAIELIENVAAKTQIYILQPDLAIQFLEAKLLSKWHDNMYQLPLAPVYGVSRPNFLFLSTKVDGNPTALSYLYDLENNKGDVNLSLFAAKTEESELKEILQYLKQKSIPFDESVIFYTSPEPYQAMMYYLAEKLQIPVTFGDGLSITYTKPGRLLYSFLNWIQNSFQVEQFLTMLQEGLLELGENAPSLSRIAYLLRKAQIGWGRERYISNLQKEINHFQEKLEDRGVLEQKSYFENQMKDYVWLHKWFTTLFKKLPIIDGDYTDYKELLNFIKFLLEEYSKTTSSRDVAAKTALIDEITFINPFVNGLLSTYEAFLNIEDLLLNMKIGQSGPMPGALHIASFKQGVFVNREHTFVVGLDNHRFPGLQREDPLLLDVERINLDRNLITTEHKGKKTIYMMLQLLASIDGSIAVSYSQFNMSENRQIHPAHLFLQCFRMKSGEFDTDYRQLEERFPTSIVSNLIEEKDWWTSLLIANDKKLSLAIMAKYPHIQNGLYANLQRNGPEFTIFDGKIESDTSFLDPRINTELTITAGKLEKLAKCPYAYFLEEVLGIKPVDEMIYDQTHWLDAASRGSLLHEIFEKFYAHLKENNEKPCFQTHEDFLKKIADHIINEKREDIPPPSDRIFEQEKEELLQSCSIFLKTEEEYCQDAEPQYFEYSFGIGEIPPAVVKLPSGMVRFSGKIDRVDKIAEDKIYIIDYKTGSTYRYDQNKSYQGGRQLQHMIYALAIESHLKLPEGTTFKSSYSFPTVKGLGERYERIQSAEMRTNGIDIIERLLDLLNTGHFPMSDNPEDCQYCELKSICRRSFYQEDVIEAKLQDVNAEGLKRFKGVRAYD